MWLYCSGGTKEHVLLTAECMKHNQQPAHTAQCCYAVVHINALALASAATMSITELNIKNLPGHVQQWQLPLHIHAHISTSLHNLTVGCRYAYPGG